MATRDTVKYRLRKGEGRDHRKIVHTGITDRPEAREREHQANSPYSRATLEKQGRKVSRPSAKAWEREQREAGKPTRGYR